VRGVARAAIGQQQWRTAFNMVSLLTRVKMRLWLHSPRIFEAACSDPVVRILFRFFSVGRADEWRSDRLPVVFLQHH
jgi:hypothetical protein